MDDSHCRVCLTRASNKSISVFNEVNDVPIDEKLQFVTGVVINQDDSFSKFMCFKCFTDTNTAYNLKTKCLDANRILKNQLKLRNQFQSIFVSDFNETVKVEPIDAHLDPIVFIEPVAIKAEVIDEWSQTFENVDCLDLKLEDTREEITTKQVTPKRQKANSFRSKNSKINSKALKCSSCPFKAIRPNDLDIHLQSAHVNGFQCSICKMNLSSLQSLTAHMKNGHEAKNIYKCTETDCDFSTESEKTLSNHIARHSNVPKCKDCDASFSAVRKLLNHRKSEHPETFDENEMPSKNKELMPLPCDVCGKLISSSQMRRHKESVHFKITRFECDFCGKKFYLKKTVKLHLQKHIPEKFRLRPFKCEICHQNFYTRFYLKSHMNLTHLRDESEFPCHCGKTFKHQQYLKHHIRYMHQQHDRPIKQVCNICGKSYFEKSALQRHINISHTKNYQKRFMCNTCGKTYYCKGELNQHERSVHGEKIFACNYEGCNKKFCLRFQLSDHEKRSHLKTDILIRNFICADPNCNKSFATKQRLVKHIQIAHEKLRENCPVGNGCKFSVGRRDYMKNHLNKHKELTSEELEKYLEIIKDMNLYPVRNIPIFV